MDQIRETISQLGEQIRRSAAYREYAEADAVYRADAPLQALVNEFNAARKDLMDERANGNKDMPKIERAQKSMQELYDKIMKNEHAQAAVQKQTAYNQFLQQIYNMINFEINGEEAGGCSGSCASCSGCH